MTVPERRLLFTKAPKATLVNRLTVALEGKHFGVDFNPAADRLRVISDTGQNLRHDVNPGGTTIADTPLNVTGATGPSTGVTAAAYTNPDTVVLGPDGTQFPAGEFVGTGERTMRCNLNSSVLRERASGFEVLGDDGRVLVRSSFPRA
ncbi:DUF4394 domain-containing protein [Phycicoccus jejuensis]|uniref:DUF4394 domain-containing protein n=1 Tax=Phycicoccus jejuensis TaxID=367299 RepID=UPI00384EE692